VLPSGENSRPSCILNADQFWRQSVHRGEVSSAFMVSLPRVPHPDRVDRRGADGRAQLAWASRLGLGRNRLAWKKAPRFPHHVEV